MSEATPADSQPRAARTVTATRYRRRSVAAGCPVHILWRRRGISVVRLITTIVLNTISKRGCRARAQRSGSMLRVRRPRASFPLQTLQSCSIKLRECRSAHRGQTVAAGSGPAQEGLTVPMVVPTSDCDGPASPIFVDSCRSANRCMQPVCRYDGLFASVQNNSRRLAVAGGRAKKLVALRLQQLQIVLHGCELQAHRRLVACPLGPSTCCPQGSPSKSAIPTL